MREFFKCGRPCEETEKSPRFSMREDCPSAKNHVLLGGFDLLIVDI